MEGGFDAQTLLLHPSLDLFRRQPRQDYRSGRARRQWYVLHSLPPSSLPPSLPLPHPPSLPPSLPLGKSTLLLAMLGELGVNDANIINTGNGPLAYAAQEVRREDGKEGGVVEPGT